LEGVVHSRVWVEAHEKTHHLQLVSVDCFSQGSAAALVGRVDVSSTVEQEPQGVNVSARNGVRKRPIPPGPLHVNICARD
jgi:hypothetical protein